MFHAQNALKQGDALSPLLLNFDLEYAIGRSKKPGGIAFKWDTSPSGLC
jgi:hypothetical protein